MLENLTHPLQCPIFETTNKNGGGADPTNRINTPTTKKRLAVPYSPTTHQLQYHQRRKA